jgi:hypothetical protein
MDSHTDCRSEVGVTVGLIDALISLARVLATRDLSAPVLCTCQVGQSVSGSGPVTGTHRRTGHADTDLGRTLAGL